MTDVQRRNIRTMHANLRGRPKQERLRAYFLARSLPAGMMLVMLHDLGLMDLGFARHPEIWAKQDTMGPGGVA